VTGSMPPRSLTMFQFGSSPSGSTLPKRR
jgi:hypothetical protein